MLRLTVIDAPPDETPAGTTKVIGPAGGTIGRTHENTWTLTDEDSLLSRSHFAISFEDGAYSLVDTSTNGSFLNDAREPLGRGNKAPLQDGDTIRIGGYRIAVALESIGSEPPPLAGSIPDFLLSPAPEVDGSEQAPGMNSPEPTPGMNSPELTPGMNSPELTPGMNSPELTPGMNNAEEAPDFNSAEQAPGVNRPAKGLPDMGELDPGAAMPVDDVPAFQGVQPQPLSDGLFGQKSKRAAESESGSSKAGLGDWKNLGGADLQSPGIDFAEPDGPLSSGPHFPGPGAGGAESPGPATPSASAAKDSFALHVPVAESPPVASAASGDSAPSGLIPDDWWVEEPASSAATPPPGQAASAAPSAPPPPGPAAHASGGVSQPSMPQDSVDPVGKASRSPVAEGTPAAGGMEAQLRLALRPVLGTHTDGLSVRDLLQVVEELSAMTHASIPRMMQALGSRTEFKDQLRLDQTMVRPRDNNPMKFCDTAEEALQHMLLNDHPGLLGGRQAMDQAFHELATHQAALLGALPAALQETVMQFSPDQVEAATEGEGMGAFALSKGKGKLWDSYRELYARLAQSDQGALERIFMKSLARYYERSLGSMK